MVAMVRMLFQPIVSLTTGKVIGFEALARCGQENPARLLRRAAERGELIALERQLRDAALAEIARAIPHVEEEVRFFLNVDTRMVREPRFQPGLTSSLCAKHGVDPRRIVLELTEHDPDVHGDLLVALIETSRMHGFTIALDDLGAGHASLAALVQLRPSIVKLERLVVQGLAHSALRSNLVEALARFAEPEGIALVAEGIEEQADLDRLSDIGVPLAQGYLLGRPRGMDHWLSGPLPARPPVSRRRMPGGSPFHPVGAAGGDDG